MSVRGPTGKFFYDHIHDLYLYHLVLENHVYDEEKDDFVYTPSGDIKIAGGWTMVADRMTAMFGREFKPSQVQRRYELFCAKEDYIAQLFEDATDFRDDMERIREVMES
jgi:hypothetical protein